MKGLRRNVDLFALHRLKQCRLRLRQPAIDLIGQHEIRKDRPLLVLERPTAGGVLHHHESAQQVRRRQVGRELDAAIAKLHDRGQGSDEQRLAQPRHTLNEHMPARHRCDEDLLDRLPLTDEHFGQLVPQGIKIILEPYQVGFN